MSTMYSVIVEYRVMRFYGALGDVDEIMRKWCEWYNVLTLRAQIVDDSTGTRVAWYVWKKQPDANSLVS